MHCVLDFQNTREGTIRVRVIQITRPVELHFLDIEFLSFFLGFRYICNCRKLKQIMLKLTLSM